MTSDPGPGLPWTFCPLGKFWCSEFLLASPTWLQPRPLLREFLAFLAQSRVCILVPHPRQDLLVESSHVVLVTAGWSFTAVGAAALPALRKVEDNGTRSLPGTALILDSNGSETWVLPCARGNTEPQPFPPKWSGGFYQWELWGERSRDQFMVHPKYAR